jgi:hypothetical protein
MYDRNCWYCFGANSDTLQSEEIKSVQYPKRQAELLPSVTNQ